MKINTVLVALSLGLASLGIGGCQSSNTQKAETTKSATADEVLDSLKKSDSDLAQLMAILKEFEGESSATAKFDESVFEKRKETATDQMVMLVVAGCLEKGEQLIDLGKEGDAPPCAIDTLARLFDPSGEVAEHCGGRTTKDAFIDCAGNGLIIGRMKAFLGQELVTADWHGGKERINAASKEMASRIIDQCIAERSVSIGSCTVEKAGRVFAVPAADIALCKTQGSFTAKIDCMSYASALALFESAAAPRI